MKLPYQLNARFETYHPGKIKLLRGGAPQRSRTNGEKLPCPQDPLDVLKLLRKSRSLTTVY